MAQNAQCTIRLYNIEKLKGTPPDFETMIF